MLSHESFRETHLDAPLSTLAIIISDDEGFCVEVE